MVMSSARVTTRRDGLFVLDGRRRAVPAPLARGELRCVADRIKNSNASPPATWMPSIRLVNSASETFAR